MREAGLVDALSILAWRIGMHRASLTIRASAEHRLRAIFDGLPSTQLVIIVKSTQDYFSPFLQRYQHLARALAAQGACVVFVPIGAGYDRVFTVKTIAPGLHITPHLGAALDCAKNPILMLFSTDSDISPNLIAQARSKGLILYDYLDVFDDRLASHPISPQRRALHADLIADSESVLCIASSHALFAEVAAARTANFCLVPNGVDSSHYSVIRPDCPPREYSVWAGTGRPVAGYFGALATWLDTDLVIAVATRMPEVVFVFVGPDLDGTGQRLKAPGLRNLFVEPAIPYDALPRAAVWFDVGLIPFKVEPLTDAVSPLKLFEYLALGLPVIATPFHEMASNDLVSTAAGVGAFTSAIARSLENTRKSNLRDLRRSKAVTADWARRADLILHLAQQERASLSRDRSSKAAQG